MVRSGLIAPSAARAVLVVGAVVAVASVVGLLVGSPDGLVVSADAGAPTISTWVVLLPSAIGIVLTLLLPWQPAPLPASLERIDRLRVTTAVLVGLAIAFPVLVGVVPLREEDYVLGKFVMLMAVPGLALLVLRGSVRIERPREAWRWWAPLAVVVAWTLLSQVAPWNPRSDLSGFDRSYLILAASATAVTAGIGEELFYRRWLQTRLEVLLGPWPAIAVTSLAFALMHLGSHGTGDLAADVARVVVVQGSFGLLVGVMWWRYRNLSMIVAVHLISNGWGVVAHLVTSG